LALRKINSNWVALTIIVAVLAVATGMLNPAFKPAGGTQKINLENQELFVEIAGSPSEWQQGLSGRPGLKPKHGMLFVMPISIPSFWMKGMEFDLDIIWIDSSGKVVAINQNLKPASYPQTFSPPTPIRYVLEIKAGYAQRFGLQVGEHIDLSHVK